MPISRKKNSPLKKIPKLGEKKAQQMILDIQSKVNILEWKKNGREQCCHLGGRYSKCSGKSRLCQKEIEQLLQQETWVEYQSLEEAMKGILKKMKQS